MNETQYIGSRYVPIFADPIEHSSAKEYEPLTIVLYEGASYTSKQYVPVGVEITDERYWALTGNYNAQVELYRRETALAKSTADDAQADIDTLLPKADFSAENTVKTYVDDSVTGAITTTRMMIDPDVYEGTDIQKLEQAIDAIGLDNGTIVIRRTYTFDENLAIPRRGDTTASGALDWVNTRLTFVGIGANAKFNMGQYSIVARDTNKSQGMLSFENIHFTGIATCFNVDYLIRCNFINCTFDKFEYGFVVPRYMQSYVFSCCTFRQIDVVLYGLSATLDDVQMNECLIERCKKVMQVYSVHGATFNQCCIENNYDVCFTYTSDSRSFNVTNCYFEANNDSHNAAAGIAAGNGLIFDFSSLQGSIQATSITNNRFVMESTSYIINIGNSNASRGFLTFADNWISLDAQIFLVASGRTNKFTWVNVSDNLSNNLEQPLLFNIINKTSLSRYNLISAGMDLNTLPHGGIWYKSTSPASSGIGHMPNDVGDSAQVTVLQLQTTPIAFAQILITTNNLYYRNQIQSAWRKVTSESVPFVTIE